jgi:hypothetical protein
MLARELNAAWIAFLPKASCMDGLSVPHTGAALPCECPIVVNIDQPSWFILLQKASSRGTFYFERRCREW